MKGSEQDYLHSLLFRQLCKLARKSFLVYLLLFNLPGLGSFILGAPHRFLVQVCQDIIDGKRKKRFILNMPPQHGKSTLVSKEFVSWVIGYQPGIHVALTGYSYTLLTDFSKAIRDRVQDPKYRMVFPELRIKVGSDRNDAWTCTNGSNVRAHSVGIKLTGRRADLLIIDDAHKGREEAESPLQRKRVRDWYLADCVSRLTPGAIVLIVGTRWHRDDLCGFLTSPEYEEEQKREGLDQELFEKVNFAALIETQEDADADPLGRKVGEALFPEVRNNRFLRSIRAAYESSGAVYEWESQFKGNPQTAGSGQADISKILKVDLHELPRSGLEFLRGWDLAVTETKTSDFSSGVLVAYHRDSDVLYIVDVWRDRLIWPKLKPAVVEVVQRDKAEFGLQRMGVEGVSGFRIGFHELQQSLLGDVKVEMRNPGKYDKLLRAQPWLNKIEAGKVRVVRGAWNRAFFAELVLFPDGDHDDQMDGVSVCHEMLTRRAVLYA